jgi:UDP-N-acetylmuramyl pentapeptide phosphotransferase/UDP-N-acetylglucosamine-1-phosphate transferase
MADLDYLMGVAAVAGLLTAFGIWILLPILRRRAILDHPNERSSHVAPTPRGGGIALIAAIVVVWFWLGATGRFGAAGGVAMLGTIVLAAVSWLDDIGGLPPSVRFAAQVAVIGLTLAWGPPSDEIFWGRLPRAIDLSLAGIAWLWFVNLFNFMDGIDGLAGSEAAAIAAGLCLFWLVGTHDDVDSALLAAAIFGAASGFLVWNWAPARIFMGDVGSIPLGFLFGYVLLYLVSRGWWKIAAILPLYFIADASITLTRRLLRGERVWQAHREHFYQQAVRQGLGHAAVTMRVIGADLALIACGWAAENGLGWWALTAAGAVVAGLLFELGRRR